MTGQLCSRATIAASALDEPDTWAVVMLYDGEVLGATRERLTSVRAVEKKKAELRRQFPNHQVVALRRTVGWVEEGP